MDLLQNIIDENSYNRLVAAFGGRRIWIPKEGNPGHHDKSRFAARNRELVSLYLKGMSPKELAARYNLSVPRVYAVLNKHHIALREV